MQIKIVVNVPDSQINRRFTLKGKAISYQDMGALIRSDNSLLVQDSSGIDYTKETLARIALSDKAEFDFAQILEALVSEDDLYEIIENGGMASYLNRQLRELR